MSKNQIHTTYFRIHISWAFRHAGKKQEWYTYGRDQKTFDSLEEVKEYMKNNYPKRSSFTIYQDRKDGKTCKVGKAYSLGKEKFRNDNNQLKTGYARHYVYISEISEKSIF